MADEKIPAAQIQTQIGQEHICRLLDKYQVLIEQRAYVRDVRDDTIDLLTKSVLDLGNALVKNQQVMKEVLNHKAAQRPTRAKRCK